MDRFVQFAVCGADQLMKNSGYRVDENNAEQTGVILGVGLGGLHTIEVFHSKLLEAGPSRISPFFIPMLISNMAPGQVAINTGAKGPNMVLNERMRLFVACHWPCLFEILLGRCDAVITGGMEATITPMGISGLRP